MASSCNEATRDRPEGPLGWVCQAISLRVPVPDGFDPLDAYFVPAGHAISRGYLELSRWDPVRRELVMWAYRQELDFGYFGGLSPADRQKMTLAEALAYIANDPPTMGLDETYALIAHEYESGVHRTSAERAAVPA